MIETGEAEFVQHANYLKWLFFVIVILACSVVVLEMKP